MPQSPYQYAPRPLATIRVYPAYQFAARLSLRGQNSAVCLSYAALTVQRWLNERIERAGNPVPEAIRCPEPTMCDQSEALKSVRLPFCEIAALPGEGMWALNVSENDPAVVGRSFVTRVGLTALNDSEVAFGVCIDVEDRDAAVEELAKAYRPQFVRLLFETEGMTISQAEALPFRRFTDVPDRRGVERLKSMYDDGRNQLPLVIFTYVARAASVIEADVPLPQKSGPELSVSLADYKAGQGGKSKPVLVYEGVKREPRPERKPQAAPRVETVEDMPYDVEEFARHLYGYAQVCAVHEGAMSALRGKFRKPRLKEGDILILEPPAFGGVRTIAYTPDLSAKYYKKTLDSLNEELQAWSKHKPYDYGGVTFLEQVRLRQRDIELEALRAAVTEEKGAESSRLMEELAQERKVHADQVQLNSALRAQNIEAHENGVREGQKHIQALMTRNDELRADNDQLKNQIARMNAAFSEATALRAIAERAQSVSRMPRDNADVVAWFKLMFADRIGFTERGEKTAARCRIKPDALWEGLYLAATTLTDLHRAGYQDIEKRFREATNWEVAMTEGAQTRKQNSLMNTREDTYDGRPISVEPHVKFPDLLKKTGAKHQRMYYAYDPETRKVIVGCVGEHLETYGSLFVH